MLRTIDLVLFQLAAICSFAQLEGKVVSIADGDTSTLLSADNRQTKVRLYGVDAPEKAQAFSAQSTKYLASLIFRKHVTIEAKNRDRYGRVVGIARVGGINVNEALLRGGYVWHYKVYDRNQNWARLEGGARVERRGLWADPKAVPPWQWRKAARRVRTR
jgi:endonuclease YncB( thermonuclease family)